MTSTHSNLDLEYLCTVIGNMAGVPVRIYSDKKLTFYHSLVFLVKDPASLYENALLDVSHPVGYYITPDFDYYGILNYEKQTIVLGPARHSAPTNQSLKKLAFDLSIDQDDMQEFLSSMKVIVNMPLESILQILCTIHYVITKEKIGLNDLAIIDSEQMAFSKELIDKQISNQFSQSEDSESIHNTFKIEQQLIDMVRSGDTVKLKKWIEQAPAVHPGKLASDMLRQMKNTFIVSTTLVSRAAIRGGMDIDDALNLSDAYIQKCEHLHSFEQLTNLQVHMITQYTKSVEELQMQKNMTDLVKSVSSYIRHHLSDAIKTNDIAASLFMSRSHLSTRFKQETGINLNDYIHFIKISEAKHLLAHTDKSLSLISNFLGYSSQAHFTRIFKKTTGITPAEYRNKL